MKYTLRASHCSKPNRFREMLWVLVTCKACGIKYRIAHKDLANKTLECGQCGHAWLSKVKGLHQRVQHEIFYLKALKQHSVVKKRFWTPATASALLCTALLLSLVLFQDFWIKNIPFTTAVYDFVGLPSTQGCIVRNVYVLKTEGEIELNGIIKNTARTYRQVPTLKVSLLYHDAKEPQILLIPAPVRYISPHEQYFFHQKIPETDRQIKNVTVEIINRLEELLPRL